MPNHRLVAALLAPLALAAACRCQSRPFPDEAPAETTGTLFFPPPPDARSGGSDAREETFEDGPPPTEREPASGTTTTPAQLELAVRDTSAFVRLGEPQPGEWLSLHREPGQSFQSYVTSRPSSRSATRTEIALLPFGRFDERQRELLRTVAAFTALYFDLPTRLLDPRSMPRQPDRIRTSRGRKWGQYLTGPFLRDVLPAALPPSAIALLGITMEDLYPSPRWNFVFGEALLYDRVGIYSLARLGPEFADQPRTEEASRVELRRSLQVVTHELGHMFGLVHCTQWACNLNGSNSLQETDRQPLYLCPDCLRMLQWNLRFDVLARYDALAGFLESVGLDDDAAWFRRRATTVRSGT